MILFWLGKLWYSKNTKLPLKLFKDYSIDGSLYNILKFSLEFQLKNGWSDFYILDNERKSDSDET